MARKLLFILFSDESCRANHALNYALELAAAGHEVRLLLEGQATRLLRELDDAASAFAGLFREAKALGLVAGACRRASGGCASDDPARDVVAIAQAHQIALLDEMRGHASIEPFVRDGYEVVTF